MELEFKQTTKGAEKSAPFFFAVISPNDLDSQKSRQPGGEVAKSPEQ
jgi:hypothetical protein